MFRTRLLMLAALCGGIPQSVVAQAVIQADHAVIQPQVYRDGATIVGCGQRILLMSVVSKDDAYVADFSVSVRADPVKRTLWAMTKAGIYRQDPRKDFKTATLVPISSFLLSSPDGAQALSPQKFIKADTPNFLLGVGRDDTAPAMELMLKMRQGDRTQFGIHLKNESVMRIYAFTPTIEPGDAESFDGCMKGFMTLINRLQKELEAEAD